MSTMPAILVVNCGSSSLKFAVFGLADDLDRLLWGAASGIGTEQGRLRVMEAQGLVLVNSDVQLEDHAAAIARLDGILRQQGEGLNLVGIEHRLVHGGPDCDCSQRVDDTPEAAQAIDFFCHCARHFIGALSAALDELDRLIFTDGIGANVPAIRTHICDGLGYLGITLDDESNREPEPLISAAYGLVQVEAVITDEERMIARHVQRLYGDRQEGT